MITIKVFPDENVKGRNEINFFIRPELATIGYNTFFSDNDEDQYWKFNILIIDFGLVNFISNYPQKRQNINFKITPLIIKNPQYPEYSFLNFKIYYYLYNELEISVTPQFEFNYLIISENKFYRYRFDIQTGVRLGLLNTWGYSLFYFETGYAYNKNKHNYYVSLGVSLLPIDPFWWWHFFGAAAGV